MAAVRVTCLSTGRVRAKRDARGLRRYLADDWSDETLPINVFLVEHPGGLCLVDAGQTAAAAAPGYFPRWYPYFRLSRFELRPEDEAAAQLARLGVDASEIRRVVLTHLHTDHAGGIAAFRDAEVVVARGEWERAQGLGGRLRGYLPQRWPPGVRVRAVDYDGPRVGPFAASHDLAGDGTLLLVPLPGHTPTHAGLLVREGGAGVICGGDAVPTAAELAATEPAVAEFCERERIAFLASHDDRAAVLAAGAGAPA